MEYINIKNKNVEEFINDFRNSKIAINCNTKEEAKEFLQFLKNLGYEWVCKNDVIITGLNEWNEYESSTCYFNDCTWFNGYNLYKKPIKNRLSYAEVEFFNRNNISVIEYKYIKEIINGDKMDKKSNIQQTIIKIKQ